MGLEVKSIELLIEAKKQGVNFDRSLTIGRQRILVKERMFRQILSKCGLIENKDSIEYDRYAEPFFKLLGSNQLESLDASDYEGATLLHDLNYPISDRYKSKFTAVYDGGSLEHIFNFPTAIKNCMELVEIGGHFICSTPTNNFMGHGFYQFSPELFFRIFHPNNGFELTKMLFYTRKKGGAYYEVSNPAEVNRRVNMVNSYPSFLFIIAKKLETVDIFKTVPQQYEYENILWKQKPQLPTKKKKGTLSWLKKLKFRRIKRKISTILNEIGTGNSKDFRKL